MSFQKFTKLSVLLKINRCNCISNIRHVSRKSNNGNDSYKTVGARKQPENIKDSLTSIDPNLETLAPTIDFPFFLPGNVGIAWYNQKTTIRGPYNFIIEQINDKLDVHAKIIFRIQSCPKVFRDTVCQLFPYRKLDNVELSVITISLKPDMKSLRKYKEIETEKLAQTFVLTAKSVCDKLRKASHWADFINPFSGRPYLYPYFNNESLYETDEKFRCLDFQIFNIENCKVISNESDNLDNRRFIGSLFTTAPSNNEYLNNLFCR